MKTEEKQYENKNVERRNDKKKKYIRIKKKG